MKTLIAEFGRRLLGRSGFSSASYWKERYAAGGYVRGGGSADKYAQFISSEIDKWTRVAKDTGASVE